MLAMSRRLGSPTVFGDRERPARIRAEQDRAVMRYIRNEVYPYSDALRRTLGAAGIDRGRVRSREGLREIPPSRLSDIADPVPYLLRPDATRIRQHGDLLMRARLQLATVLGRQPALAHGRIDPVFKPVHWTLAEGLLIGSSAADLDRLGELGRRWLEAAGVRPDDVLVSLVAPAPTVGYWQLVLGARRAGLSALYLRTGPTAAQAEYLRPTVLAGPAADLLALVDESIAESRDLGAIRTVLVVDERFDPTAHRRLANRLPGAAIVVAWAPPGVRALWAQCRDGAGLHTWPAAEIIDLIDPVTAAPSAPGALGEVVWSALGWRGTALLRLRTGVLATLHEGPCAACGRTNPRLELLALPSVLDAHPAVRGWQVELRTAGGRDEVVVFATLESANGDIASTLLSIDEGIGAAQFVVLDDRELDARLAAHGGARVLDRR
jgi:hypothetical protein